MQTKLNKTDTRRVLTFEKFVKNINSELKGKSTNEINDIFDLQDKIINGISVEELKNQLLNQSKELKNMAIGMTNKFDSIIDNLMNSDKLLEGKNLDEATQFFDEIDKNITSIPDQRMRQVLMKKAEYFRASKLDDMIVIFVQNTFKLLNNDYSLAGKTEKAVNVFFDGLSIKIKKIANKNIAGSLLALLSMHKMSALNKIEIGEYDGEWF